MNTQYRIVEGGIQYGKKTFRTPFKVVCMAINPANDLIALGSKTGEVIVKRTSWKLIWRHNIGMISNLGRQNEKAEGVESLEFSPDGELLAVGTDRGQVQIWEVESGKFKHSSRIDESNPVMPSVKMLRWSTVTTDVVTHNEFDTHVTQIKEEIKEERKLIKATKLKNGEKPSALDQCYRMMSKKPEVAREDIGFVFQMHDEDSALLKLDDGIEETLEHTFLVNKHFRESMENTILIAITDDNRIVVLAAGVFPMAKMNMEKVLEPYQNYPIHIYDAHYTRSAGGVSILLTTYGPKLIGAENTGDRGPIIAFNKDDVQGQTVYLCIKLELHEKIWEMALRFMRLCYGYTMLTVSYETTKKNWAEQMKLLHKRFDTQAKHLKIGDILVDMLLCGATESSGEAFLERGMGIEGLTGIRDFCEKHLTEMSRVCRGQLTGAARNLSFQSTEFIECTKAVLMHNHFAENCRNVLMESERNGPANTRNLKFEANNEMLKRLECAAQDIELKVKQLTHQCSMMLQDINHLTKWISLLKPFARGIKVNALMRSKRMDIRQLMKDYISPNFLQDPVMKERYDSLMFDIRGVIEKQQQKEMEEKFDESAYYTQKAALAATDAKDYALHIFKTAVNKKFGGSDENRRKSTESMDATESTSTAESTDDASKSDESTWMPIDLDRIGSFFTTQLTERTINVLPNCGDFLEGLVEDGSAMDWKRMERDARGIGFEKCFTRMASAILSTDIALTLLPNGQELKKFEILYMYIIESGATHQGFVSMKVSRAVYDQFSMDLKFHPEQMKRALHISGTKKTTLLSFLIVPKYPAWTRIPRPSGFGLLDQYSRLFIHEEQNPLIVELHRLAADDNVVEMEVDENRCDDELRIDVENSEALDRSKYCRLMEFDQVYHQEMGELVVTAKFATHNEADGQIRRMMTTCGIAGDMKKVLMLHDHSYPASEVMESEIVCSCDPRGAYLFEDGSRITIFSMMDSDQEDGPQEGPSTGLAPIEKGRTKTFRDYQQRRERCRLDGQLQQLASDIGWDVHVQNQMDEEADLSDVANDESRQY